MIRGRLLQLRAMEKADLPMLHRLHNDSKTMGYFFEEPFETVRELEDLYEKHVHNTTERRFVLETVGTNEPVGVLSLIEIDEINRKCEIDIIIDEKYRGKGFGKHGFVLGIKYAFDVLNLFKVYLLILPHNEAGQRIYVYAGLKRECVLKKEFYVNGKYFDVHRMCIFANEWKKLREKLRQDVGFDYDMIPELIPNENQDDGDVIPFVVNR